MEADCKLVKGLIVACEPLANATSDYQGHYKKGMSIMPITRMEKVNGKVTFNHVKDYLIVKNGKYAKDGILCKYCPFCGKSVYRKSRKKIIKEKS